MGREMSRPWTGIINRNLARPVREACQDHADEVARIMRNEGMNKETIYAKIIRDHDGADYVEAYTIPAPDCQIFVSLEWIIDKINKYRRSPSQADDAILPRGYSSRSTHNSSLKKLREEIELELK